MYKTAKNFLLLSLTALTFTACLNSPCGINKKYFLTNFEAFVEEVKNEDLPYNDEAWVKYDNKYKQFKDECFEKFRDTMTDEEKEEFFTNSAKYYWLRYGSGFVNQILDKDSEVIENMLDNLRDAWNSKENNIDDAIDELRKEVDKIDKEKLEDLFKDMGDDIENWGKEIEEIFKDVDIELNEGKNKK